MTPQSIKARLDWRTVSAVASIVVLIGSLLFGYASGSTQVKDKVERHEDSIKENRAKIEKLDEKKADKDELKRVEDKQDQMNDKLDRILFMVARGKK